MGVRGLDEDVGSRRLAVRNTCLDEDLPWLQRWHWGFANVQVFERAFSVLNQYRPHV